MKLIPIDEHVDAIPPNILIIFGNRVQNIRILKLIFISNNFDIIAENDPISKSIFKIIKYAYLNQK